MIGKMKEFIRRYREFRGCGYPRKTSFKAALYRLELNDVYFPLEDRDYYR